MRMTTMIAMIAKTIMAPTMVVVVPIGRDDDGGKDDDTRR
jgi:hypothetical protein